MKFSDLQRWRSSVYLHLPISSRLRRNTNLGIGICCKGFEKVHVLIISLQTMGSFLSESSWDINCKA